MHKVGLSLLGQMSFTGILVHFVANVVAIILNSSNVKLNQTFTVSLPQNRDDLKPEKRQSFNTTNNGKKHNAKIFSQFEQISF